MILILVGFIFVAIIFAILGYTNNSPKYNSIAILCIIVELILTIAIKQQLL